MMMVRSFLFALALVGLSENPGAQIGTVIGLFVIWCIYSFCYCPYFFFIRVFIRLYEIIFLSQIALLAISILKPEYSRMTPAIILLVLNFVQLAILLGLSLAIFLFAFFDLKCLRIEDNLVENV